jgi:hypothetical protein
VRTSQETGTRARAGLVFQKAPSPGAFVAAFHWNYVVGSASASPASLLTNERRPWTATKHLGSPRSVRRCPHQAKAGARRGRRAGATLLSTWSGASRPRRCGPTASRWRTGGAALAFCAWVLWRRVGCARGCPARASVAVSSRVGVGLSSTPLMLRGDGLSCAATRRGSASHEVLARLDFRGLCDGSEVSL